MSNKYKMTDVVKHVYCGENCKGHSLWSRAIPPCFNHRQMVISILQRSATVQSRKKLISFQFCSSVFLPEQ